MDELTSPGLTGGESEAATSTVSPIPHFGAPGSESQSTDEAGTLGPVIPEESDNRDTTHGQGHRAAWASRWGTTGQKTWR